MSNTQDWQGAQSSGGVAHAGGDVDRVPGRATLADSPSAAYASAPGKSTLVQRTTSGAGADSFQSEFMAGFAQLMSESGHGSPATIAASGTQGAPRALPYFDAIQRSFGRHDIAGIRAFIGGPAAHASRALGAAAYAHGEHIAFEREPDLHMAAHEAAHVIQQRAGVSLAGGIDGGAGDPHERHADAIADLVVRGQSAEALLDAHGGGGGGAHTGVQRAPKTAAPSGDVWQNLFQTPSQPVGKLGRIKASAGRHLVKAPAPGAPATSGVIGFNGVVHVERRTTQADVAQRWVYVVALDGGAGFCEEQFVAIDPPEPTAKLYLVTGGQTLGQIADQFYPSGDQRLYVQALYEANKGRSGITLTHVDLGALDSGLRGADEQQTLKVYRGVQAIAGQPIWIPSLAFVQQMKASGKITNGSTVLTEAWQYAEQKLGPVADLAAGQAGYVVGAFEGGFAAIRDLVKGAAEMLGVAYDFVKSIIGGELMATIRKAAQKLYEFCAKVPDLAKALGASIAKRWQAAGAYGKGEMIGEVVGYIATNVVLVLATGGGAIAAAIAEYGGEIAEAALAVLRVVDAAANPVTYIRPLARAIKVPGELLAKVGREGRAARGAERSLGETVEHGVADGKQVGAAERDAAHAGEGKPGEPPGAAKRGAATGAKRVIAEEPVELLGHQHTLTISATKEGDVAIWLCSNCARLREEIASALAVNTATSGPTKSIRRRLEKLQANVLEIEKSLQTPGAHVVAPNKLNQVKANLVDLSKKFPSADPNCAFCAFHGKLDYDALANMIGFEKTRARSHGQAVYRRGNEYISPDIDRHNGGIWKKALGGPENLTAARREGTFNEDLAQQIGP